MVWGDETRHGKLVKAYGDTAKAVIAVASWEEHRLWVKARVVVDWAEHRRLKNELEAVQAIIDSEAFEDGVTLEVRIPAEAFKTLQAWTINLTRGHSRWKPLD